MDEGALERNGVLLSTEKYRGGALTEQVQSAPFPTAVSLLFWLSSLGDRLIGKVQIPRAGTSAQPPLRWSQRQPPR